jgi:hypothetical protein
MYGSSCLFRQYTGISVSGVGRWATAPPPHNTHHAQPQGSIDCASMEHPDATRNAP